MIEFEKFLEHAIAVGIEDARKRFAAPEFLPNRQGALIGYELCRQKDPDELALLLAQTTADRKAAFGDAAITGDQYRQLRNAELSIDWICTCVSVVLEKNGYETIVPTTARAYDTVVGIIQRHGSSIHRV